MSRYANAARVHLILQSESEPDVDTFDALNATVSAELDAACRVVGFGTDPEPRTRFVTGAPHASPPGSIVVLDPPAVAVESIEDDGIAVDNWRLIWDALGRMWGIQRTDGAGWGAEVSVTGHFADQPPGPIPPEIVEAASVLVAGYLRRDRLPAGEVSGPEGLTFRPSNPWSDERVKRAVKTWLVKPLVV